MSDTNNYCKNVVRPMNNNKLYVLKGGTQSMRNGDLCEILVARVQVHWSTFTSGPLNACQMKCLISNNVWPRMTNRCFGAN